MNDEYDDGLTAKELAEVLGLNELTCRRWAAAGCPHGRMPDGSLRFHKQEVKDWQQEFGVTGAIGRPEQDWGLERSRRESQPDHSDNFYKHCLLDPLAEPAMPDQDERVDRRDRGVEEFEGTDAALYTPLERDLILKRRTLTPDELAEYARSCVWLKVVLIEEQRWLAGWLAGKCRREIERRLRSAVIERYMYLADRCRDITDAQDGIERDDDGNPLPKRKRQRSKA